MRTLSIDLETFSDEDLRKSGVYRYAESPAFEILLFGVSVDGGPVAVYDLCSGDVLPEEILSALTDNNVIKTAFNASFERICLSVYLRRHYPQHFRSYGVPEDSVGNYLDPTAWRCTLVLSAYNGLPLSLEMVGGVLGFEEQKLKEGKDLIRYFCIPCKPTISNGGRTRNLPEHAPDRWKLFKKYNQRDIEVEMQIQERLRNYPVPDTVWDEYHLDQKINDRGIMVDPAVVGQAIRIDDLTRTGLTEKLHTITHLDNPNSVAQMKDWLSENGMEMESLGKKEVAQALADAPDEIRQVLSLRLQLAKSSVKKYQAMQNAVCHDGRCRGMFQFYGANRSGRWAGRLIQLQNLPQNHLPDLEQARELVKAGDYQMLSVLYDNVPQVLSELIRTAFVPKPGYKFIVSDFSAIEARVLSHLAGETWRSEVFRNNGDIYCASASQMFHVPVEKHGKNSHLRQKGKIAELALGYGGSVGALKAMGATDMGIPEEELQPLVNMWRQSNPRIVEYWWQVDSAVKTVIKQRTYARVGDVKFFWQAGMLFIELPSGRRLAYVKPRIGENKFGGESVTYLGIDAKKKWSRIESYGPKFTENIVQAISRDILAYTMITLKNYKIVGHVHDEVIIEVNPEVSVVDVCELMGRTPPWIPGLLLRADGYECNFYKKD